MKKIIAIAAFGSMFTVSAVHAAGSGTVNFVGAVTTQTCNANVGGSTTSTVTLPTVQASSLATLGSTAGETAFKVDVTGCATTNPSGAGTVKAYFEKGANVDADGRLINSSTETPANNVVLELVDSTGKSAIKAGDMSQNTNNYVNIVSSNATLPYAVRYYATGAATAGSVKSSVTYSLIYK